MAIKIDKAKEKKRRKETTGRSSNVTLREEIASRNRRKGIAIANWRKEIKSRGWRRETKNGNAIKNE